MNPVADRARLLEGLRCVDAVVVFDDDAPDAPTLAALRPDVWVKGGDYRAEDLPETALVARRRGPGRRCCPSSAGPLDDRRCSTGWGCGGAARDGVEPHGGRTAGPVLVLRALGPRVTR